MVLKLYLQPMRKMLKIFRLPGSLEPLIHALIWASFVLVVWFQVQTLGPFRKGDGSIYLPMFWNTLLSMALFYMNALYLVPRFFSRHRFGLYIGLLIALYLGIVLLNTAFDHFYAISLFSSEKEPLIAEFNANLISKSLILSLSLGYGLTKNWVISNKLQQQLVSDHLSTQLKYLKAQINPHFLFNTLNMAYASAVKSEDAVTADIIEKISGFMRYVLYESNEDQVPLEKELRYIDNYINLQLQRLSPEIASSVTYEVKGDFQNFSIAPMILIPFIENVFKHGIMISKKPAMSISLLVSSGTLFFKTTNLKNNSAVGTDKAHSGIGMKNAKERLLLVYPRQHQLQINNSDDFFQVTLEMQLKPVYV
jgi:sensor histidine kinase YesM